MINDCIGDFIASGKYTVVFTHIFNDDLVILNGNICQDAFKLLAYKRIGSLHDIEIHGNDYYAIVDRFDGWRKNGDCRTKTIIEYFSSLVSDLSEVLTDDYQFLSELLHSKMFSGKAQAIIKLALDYGNFEGMWLDNHLGNWFVSGKDCLPIDLFNFDLSMSVIQDIIDQVRIK